MGLFDIFTDDNEKAARDAQVAGLNAANTQAQANIDTGYTNANQFYGQARQPWEQLFGQFTQGATKYGDMTGANGKAAQQKAVDDFVASPATQYLVQTGNENALRNASRAGTTASGQTLVDLNNVAEGQALQNWNNTVAALQPYLQGETTAAGGESNVSGQQAQNATNTASQKAGYDWNTQTGIGNANANFELSKNNSSANIWSAIMGGLNMLSGGGGLTGLAKGAQSLMNFSGGGGGSFPSGNVAPATYANWGVPNWAQ